MDRTHTPYPLRRARCALRALVALCVLAVCAGVGRAREVEPEREATIKAGMVLNFVRYTEWPDSSFERDDSPITVLVLGEGAILEQLQQAAPDLEARGRKLRVVAVDFPEPESGQTEITPEDLDAFVAGLRAAHMVVVCESEEDRVGEVLASLEGSDVLTVSDVEDFAERGGMLGLSIRRGRVAIDANPEEIEDTDLRVSSHVLRLARVVQTRRSR